MTITSTNSPNYTRLASTWLDILSRRQGMKLGCVTIERTEEDEDIETLSVLRRKEPNG